MRLHRFIGMFDCAADRIVIADAHIINQIVRVLRLNIGDRLILGDGAGGECQCVIAERGREQLICLVIERVRNTNDPLVSGILYCSILKREHFELVVQKATEIGIREIVPVITARTVKLAINEDRLRTIMIEAAEQSGRGFLPTLHAPMAFSDALTHAAHNAINLFFHFDGIAMASVDMHGKDLRGLFIGPEGGWTDEEVAAARAAGCIHVSLGTLTMRAETAAIVASYLGVQS